MNWHKLKELPRSAYLMPPILALAFYLAFIPHQGYPYPVHIDEWVHLAYAKALLKAGSVSFPDPFLGERIITISSNLEAGFHLFWGVFHQLSGISWLTIFKYFPGIIFIITVFSAYVLGERQGFGWEAALFVSLIPTTVGILGPGFLVPVAMGLPFIPLALFLAFNFRTVPAYFALFLLISFLLSIHAPSAIIVVLLLVPYILLNLKGNFKHSLGITLALAIPFLAPFPWIVAKLLPTAKELLISKPLPAYVSFPRVLKEYGYLPTALCLLGTFLLAIRGGRRSYGLILGLLALLVMLVSFYSFHYGLSVMYERGLVFMMLTVGIVAGAGLAGVRNFHLPTWLTTPLRIPPLVARHTGKLLCLGLVGLALALAIPERQDATYYHIIDGEDYQAFVWVRENVSSEYKKAILEPWKATAFTAITGKNIYTRIHAYPTSRDQEAAKFLEEGASDTAFLKENGISIVYTRGEVRNPDLVEVRDNVYLLKSQ